MQSTTARLARRAILTAACAGTLVAGLLVPALSSSAATRPAAAKPAPVVAGSTYLALGDSVTFGYREPNTAPAPNYEKANTFVGYPEDIGRAFGLKVVNAACSGETSGSFINVKAQSNGCEHTYTGGPGYRSAYPLHVKYSGSQLAFAEKFLKTHKQTRLVSLMIGANDAFICEETTKDGCVKELGGVIKKIEKNVTTILTGIRDEAGYKGQIVILNYYSTDYANGLDNLGSKALNMAQDTAAAPFGVKIANGYGAFRVASVHSALDTCKAGLLTQLTGADKGTCGVHPSSSGASVLAQVVEEAFKK
jgi:lysophospholipase L1-like esterase